MHDCYHNSCYNNSLKLLLFFLLIRWREKRSMYFVRELSSWSTFKKKAVSLLLTRLFLHIFACDITEAFIIGGLVNRSRKCSARLFRTLQLSILLLASTRHYCNVYFIFNVVSHLCKTDNRLTYLNSQV